MYVRTYTDVARAHIAGIMVTAEGAVVQAAGLKFGHWGQCLSVLEKPRHLEA